MKVTLESTFNNNSISLHVEEWERVCVITRVWK